MATKTARPGQRRKSIEEVVGYAISHLFAADLAAQRGRIAVGSAPPGVEHAAPVVPADRPELVVAEARSGEGVDELRQAGGSA